MFYVTGFNGNNIVTVYDDRDKTSEDIFLTDLESNWDLIGHLFATRFYSKPYDSACLCSLNSTSMAPFDIVDSSGILYTTEIFNSLGVYDWASFQDYADRFTVIYGDDHNRYLGTNFCIALRNNFCDYYEFVPYLYRCINNTKSINNLDIRPVKYLLMLYYNNLIQIKYKINPFLFYQFNALNVYTENNLYVVEFDSELICIWYLLAFRHFGLLTGYFFKDKRIRLKDFLPDILQTISKVVGTLVPVKFDGNKLYFKASGNFRTLQEVAKHLTMGG